MSANTVIIKKTVILGLMLAMVIILLWFERMLPPLPVLPPNFKLGLSNIIVMYVLFFIGKKEAVTIAVLKAFFNVLMRGPVSGLLSLSGGLASVLVIILLTVVFKDKISYAALSIAGAVFHNIGQFAAISLIFQNFVLFAFYIPFVLVVGTVSGVITGALLKVVLPLFENLQKQLGGKEKL